MGWILGAAALLGARITAFYMTRVMLMTFFGEKRWVPDAEGHEPHPHESPCSHDAPDGRAGVRIGLRGLPVRLQQLRSLNWLTPVTGHSEGNSPSARYGLR